MSDRVHCPQTDWLSCTECGLSESRRRVVLRGYGRVRAGTVERGGKLLYYKGELDSGEDETTITGPYGVHPLILFIGEAPGAIEDITGRPFMGEAGRIFHLCLSQCTSSFDFEVTNIIACRPWELSKYGNITNRPPSPEEIRKCKPRVKELIEHIQYDGYVYLGNIAKEMNLKNALSLDHPSFILRKEFKMFFVRKFADRLDQYVDTECKGEFQS